MICGRRDVGVLRDGQVDSAQRRPSVMTMEMTEANIGRSMQKWEMFMVAVRYPGYFAYPCPPYFRPQQAMRRLLQCRGQRRMELLQE